MADPILMRVAPEPDYAKIALLESVLARLRNGEQFVSMAVLISNSEEFCTPLFDGRLYELLVLATRFEHELHERMDAQREA